ncbi:MAG: hypothetical protein F6K19_48875 [Cyanothece sp. SIO1E1]|nr:hypothetical protein [Cyanothece sp. SIO1E1]
MLTIPLQIVKEIQRAQAAVDLHRHLQAAIELEHSTIPPYLTAMYSIKQGYNQEAYRIIRSVVVEEMLHMVVAANVLNAIGGHPIVNRPDFIPSYPGPLPMNVGHGLQVGLAALSKEVLWETFVAIEKPDNPQDFPRFTMEALRDGEEGYATIGDFYQAIIAKIEELGEAIFTGDPSLQITNEQWFPASELFPILDVKTAIRALTLIVEQGEGLPEGKPVDPEGNLAHYYRFLSIYYGKQLVKDPSVPEGYSYSGTPIPFEEDGIWNLVTNSKANDYSPGTKARRLVDQFNVSYTSLLNSLHDTMNGNPNGLNQAMGLMYDLKLQAQHMVEIELTSGRRVSPSFEYATVNAPVMV